MLPSFGAITARELFKFLADALYEDITIAKEGWWLLFLDRTITFMH